MNRTLVIGLLFISVGRCVAAEPAAKWQMPDAEVQLWVERLRELRGGEVWTISAKGNEIAIARKEPVAMMAYHPNPPAPDEGSQVEGTPDGVQRLRYTLRFAPRMPMDEYERLAAINEASEQKHIKLRDNVGLPYKFDDLLATTPEEKIRLRAYRQAVAKLPRHELPDFYTHDRSVYLRRNWHLWRSPADNAVSKELLSIEDDLARYFGMYDAAAASGRTTVGEYLEIPARRED